VVEGAATDSQSRRGDILVVLVIDHPEPAAGPKLVQGSQAIALISRGPEVSDLPERRQTEVGGVVKSR